MVGDHNVGLRGREVLSPPHLHSDPIQVFDVQQHQTQDPVGSWQGGPVGSTDAHLRASVCPPAYDFLGVSAVLSPILASPLGSLGTHRFSPPGPYFMFSTLRPRTAHTGIARMARKRIQPL